MEMNKMEINKEEYIKLKIEGELYYYILNDYNDLYERVKEDNNREELINIIYKKFMDNIKMDNIKEEEIIKVLNNIIGDIIEGELY